jgi:hypothetical protein
VNIQQAYPGNHKIEPFQILSSGNRVVSPVYVNADAGQKAFTNSNFEFKDGKICRITEFWGDSTEGEFWAAKAALSFCVEEI